MISHRYRCIFIHIAKCAGTSIENAFGIDTENHDAKNNNSLFGWDDVRKLWLQHATPQQLIDLKLISRPQWNSYYKFIVYRNSWDRAYSDYKWMKQVRKINDTFRNYINRSGEFERILTEPHSKYYAGDHLNYQKDYFFLDNKRIKYDLEMNFQFLDEGFQKLKRDLDLHENFFDKRLNSTLKKKDHYSHFYDRRKKNLVKKKFAKDIEFFNFQFENKRLFFKNFWL